MYRKWISKEEHLAFDGDDTVLFSHFQCYIAMIGEGSTYRGKACCTLERSPASIEHPNGSSLGFSTDHPHQIT
jgi:hypothetical protein